MSLKTIIFPSIQADAKPTIPEGGQREPVGRMRRISMESPLLLRSHSSNVYAVDAARDGTVASCGDDGTIVWSNDGRPTRRIASKGDDAAPTTNVAFVDPNRLMTSTETTLRLHDARSDVIIREYVVNDDDVNEIAIDPSSQYAAACDDSGQIRVVDLRQNRLYRTLRRDAHANICTTAKFCRSAASLASGGLDARIVAWDVAKAKCVAKISMLDGGGGGGGGQFVNPPLVHSIAMHRGGATGVAAVAMGDFSVGWVRVDRNRMKDVGRLGECHAASVSQVAFSRNDGNEDVLVSGGNDGRIVKWSVGVEKGGRLSETAPPTVIEHGSKINWLATSFVEPLVYVADQTSNVSIYRLS